LEQDVPLTIIILDVDYFKQYNDYYGHGAGDDCLRILARLLHQQVPSTLGLLARYGGEEFAAVLPRCSLEQALDLAEQLRSQVALANLPHRQSLVGKRVTLSMGIVTTRPQGDMHVRQVVDEADRLLYLAKHQGRDRICYSQLPGSPACILPKQ
jgi:diguanylate cyclase (GGDEF)-like protein